MAGEKILIVDDEKNMRELLKDFFEEEGYSIVLAEDGQQALEVIDETIDMVISDNRMPQMQGMELMVQIKKSYPDTPVIIITAFTTPKLAVEAYKMGASSYLTKPFNPEELLAKMKEIFRQKRMAHRREH